MHRFISDEIWPICLENTSGKNKRLDSFFHHIFWVRNIPVGINVFFFPIKYSWAREYFNPQSLFSSRCTTGLFKNTPLLFFVYVTRLRYDSLRESQTCCMHSNCHVAVDEGWGNWLWNRSGPYQGQMRARWGPDQGQMRARSAQDSTVIWPVREWMSSWTCLCVYKCVYVYLRVCVCACVCVCVCVCVPALDSQLYKLGSTFGVWVWTTSLRDEVTLVLCLSLAAKSATAPHTPHARPATDLEEPQHTRSFSFLILYSTMDIVIAVWICVYLCALCTFVSLYEILEVL